MLKALVNEARLHLDITTTGPLLVKTGYATLIGADMAPVQTYRNGQPEVYLPGSSLKGVFRSHIEKVINSIQPGVACNPLQSLGTHAGGPLYRGFCGNDFTDKDLSHLVYAGSCPVCRLFGSTAIAGRLAIEDAYLPQGVVGTKDLIEHRDGVAIDRLTGGASGRSKFDLETVTAETTFTTALHLRNFEIWQLGLLFVIIQDLEDELIRIGSGRSRGLGKVKASISERPEGSHPGGVVLSTPRTKQNMPQPEGQKRWEPDDEIWGLGRWLGSESELYDTRSDDLLPLSSGMAHTQHYVRNHRVFKDVTLKDLRDRCVEVFVARMQEWAPTVSTRRKG